jgi:hypothetical protein
MKDQSPTNAEIPVEKLGPPGIKGQLHVLAIRPDEKRDDQQRLHDDSIRLFKVAARLSKSPPSQQGIKGDFTLDDGSSYLLIPPEAAFTRVRCPSGMFECKKNEKGEHSLIEFECVANSVQAARDVFIRAVLPFLDVLTFQANAPLFVATIRIEDMTNERTAIEYVAPYRPVIINPHISEIEPELDPVYAMYREAQNSNSDFYKFLCYHKLLEGIYGAMRAKLFKDSKSLGIALTKRREHVPYASDIVDRYQPYIGRPIKEFLDNVLTPQFRNAVAHFITDDGEILNMSDPTHMDSYSGVLYVTELCVREAIVNFAEMLKELKAKK